MSIWHMEGGDGMHAGGARQAITEEALDIRIRPDAASQERIVRVNTALGQLGMDTLLGTNVAFSGTEADIPTMVVTPSRNPEFESRANLPA